MTIILEIGCYATVHKLLFDDRESADAALAELRPKLGRDLFGRNGGEDYTHTIRTPTGNVVVACNKVEVVRVIDVEEWERRAEPMDDKALARTIDYEVRRAAALRGALKPKDEV